MWEFRILYLVEKSTHLLCRSLYILASLLIFPHLRNLKSIWLAQLRKVKTNSSAFHCTFNFLCISFLDRRRSIYWAGCFLALGFCSEGFFDDNKLWTSDSSNEREILVSRPFFLVSGKRNEKMKFYNLNEVWKTSAFWGGRALRCTWIELHINEDKRLRTRGIWIIFYVSD